MMEAKLAGGPNKEARTTLAVVLSKGARPKRPSPPRAVWIFIWRSFRRTFKMAHYLALDVLVFPLIFLLIFTYLFGGAISGSTGNYLQFLLPGMLVYTVTTMTVYTGAAISTDIQKGVFNRFRTLPFWQPAAVFGSFTVSVLTYSAAVTTTFLFGMMLGFRPEAGFSGAATAMLLVVLYAFSVSWIFAFVGVVAKKTESVTNISYLFLYPLMFASNVFVDSSTMPSWLQRFVDINPLSLASTAVRGLMHGSAAAGDVGLALAGMLGILAVFAPLTVWRYVKKAA